MVKGKILLIGASGMLARALQQTMDAQGLAHLDVDYPQLDLANPRSIAAQVTGEHAIVINAAAWTDVDGAEDPAKYPLAESVNGTGVGELALCCRRVGAMLVHYSTDYVFNGQASEPYRVDQPHDPINAYGRSKALGERLLLESGCDHLLIRTSWLYAPWGKNFVRTIHDLARSKPMLQVVNDQHGRPTSAQHLAHATLGLLSQNTTGCWHVTDGGQCSWFDFATAIARFVQQKYGSAARIEPCSSTQYPRPAQRPAYSVLDVAATIQRLGPLPDWHHNLQQVLETLEPHAAAGSAAPR